MFKLTLLAQDGRHSSDRPNSLAVNYGAHLITEEYTTNTRTTMRMIYQTTHARLS